MSVMSLGFGFWAVISEGLLFTAASKFDETRCRLSGGKDKSWVMIWSCGISLRILTSVSGMFCLCFMGVKNVVEYFFIRLARCKD